MARKQKDSKEKGLDCAWLITSGSPTGLPALLKVVQLPKNSTLGTKPLTYIQIQDANYSEGDSCYRLKTDVIDHVLYLQISVASKHWVHLAKTELTLFSPRVSPSWTLEDEFGDIWWNGASGIGTRLRTEKLSRQMLPWAPSWTDSLWVYDSLTTGVLG